MIISMHNSIYSLQVMNIWVRSWRCRCLVPWFCSQLIAKSGNKTVIPPCSDPWSLVFLICGICRLTIDIWLCLPRNTSMNYEPESHNYNLNFPLQDLYLQQTICAYAEAIMNSTCSMTKTNALCIITVHHYPSIIYYRILWPNLVTAKMN